jgi:pullulanase
VVDRAAGRSAGARHVKAAHLALMTTLLSAAGTAAAGAPPPMTIEDCNVAGHATLLHGQSEDVPADARAVWLDATHLLWPGQSARGNFRLRSRGVDAAEGQDITIDLVVAGTQVPEALAKAYPHLREGALLALPDTTLHRIDDLLRGELVLLRVDSSGRTLDATTTQIAGALDARYATAAATLPLGVGFDKPGTTFSLWAPTAYHVAACIFDRGDSAARTLLPLQQDAASGIWQATTPEDLSGGYFTYVVDVFAPGTGFVRNRVTDPYAVSLTTDSTRAYIADLEASDLKPPGWDTAPRPAALPAITDMAIYELHVRDFSIGDSTVPAAHRGKYLAFTDTASDGMRHLRALADAGITDLHLLPVFDLATVPEHGCVTPEIAGTPDGESQQAAIAAVAARDCFNWGYDPFHYTAPEGSYATDATDGAVRIREFRAMVQALHGLGLRVGMDVVYNHTSASGQDAKSVLDPIVPGYYHRLDANGRVERSTCCDNTATEHRMMERLMIDSAVAWAKHYRIDSFRFDLMGHQPRAAMERLQAAVDRAGGRHIDLLGEGWNFGEVKDGARFVQASQLSLNGSGIATFSDRARDAARGGSAGDNGIDQVRNQGWLNGRHFAPNASARGQHSREDLARSADLLRVGLAGSLRDFELTTAHGDTVPMARIDYAGQPAGYTSEPGEVVNYVENHDNQTLFDANVFKLPRDTSTEDRARVQILGAALVAFSQGMAYFHAGQEILRSKSMDRNSFDSGDWFNRLDWTQQDNGFGAGLPPQQDNAASWDLMRPLLADPAIKPTPADIAWTRDAFLDLLRIRASSTLIRLRTADDVQRRLRFPGSGPTQTPTLVAGHLDGRDHDGAGFGELLYAINTDTVPQSLTLADAAEKAWTLHPVHLAPDAADQRARDSRFDAATGTFTIPPRTAVVYVLAQTSY